MAVDLSRFTRTVRQYGRREEAVRDPEIPWDIIYTTKGQAAAATVKLMLQSIGAGTRRAYYPIARDLLKYVNREDQSTITAEVLTTWLGQVASEGRRAGWVDCVKAAVSFFADLNFVTACWSDSALRALVGLRKKTARTKAATRKAPGVDVAVVKCILERVSDAEGALVRPMAECRATAMSLLQFLTLSRCRDNMKLEARDFELSVAADGDPIILVRYRTSKCDVFFRGQFATIRGTGGRYCPYRFFVNYFRRCGLKFSNEEEDQGVVFPTIRWVQSEAGRVQLADSRSTPSVDVLLRDMRKLCASVGYAGKITSTSFKRGGVTFIYGQGGRQREVQVAGRWATPGMAARYRTDLDRFREEVTRRMNFEHVGAAGGWPAGESEEESEVDE